MQDLRENMEHEDNGSMSVVPELRIDVLHVPAERFAVQLSPQCLTVCDTKDTSNKEEHEEKVTVNRVLTRMTIF